MSSEVRRGWPLIVSAGLGVVTSSVVLPYNTIGAFVKPLTSAFGWSRSDVHYSIILSSGLGALTAPLVGWLSDRYGPRAVALPGIVGLSIGFFIAASMNGTVWMFLLSYGCMAMLGAGTSPVTWTRAISTSFRDQRGLALGLTLTGTGICATLAPLFAVHLIDAFGWRVAYLGIGVLPLFALPVIWMGFRPTPGGVLTNAHPMPATALPGAGLPEWGLTLGESVRGYRFWVLSVSIFAIYMAITGISPNLIAALTDKGFTPARAATAQSTYGFAIIIGRLGIGALIDRYWAPAIGFLSLLLPAIGCLLLTGSISFTWIIVASLMIGLAVGAELDLMAYLCSRYFGLRHYGQIYAVLYSILAVASGGAVFLFARVFDRTGSYRLSFMIAAALFVTGASGLLLLGRYPDRRSQFAHPPNGAFSTR